MHGALEDGVWAKHSRSAKHKRSLRGMERWQTTAGMAVLCVAALMLAISFIILGREGEIGFCCWLPSLVMLLGGLLLIFRKPARR